MVGAGQLAGRIASCLGEAGDEVAVVDDPAGLRERLAAADLAVAAGSVSAASAQTLAETAVHAGVHLVDVASWPTEAGPDLERLDTPARAAGVTVVLASAPVAGIGDLLADVAAAAVHGPREIHVTYDLRGWRRGLSRGTRAAVARHLAAPAVAWHDGGIVTEAVAEQRRLAWFPRHVGPGHAVGIGGLEPFTVPRHVPGVDVVRTYLAMPTWRAEAVQAAASTARWPAARRRLVAWLGRGGPARPDPSTRWACVAEVAGSDGIARAWASGRDPYGCTAAGARVLVEAVRSPHAEPGVVPPALVDVPGELLDRYAAATGLRWGLVRPSPSGP